MHILICSSNLLSDIWVISDFALTSSAAKSNIFAQMDLSTGGKYIFHSFLGAELLDYKARSKAKRIVNFDIKL